MSDGTPDNTGAEHETDLHLRIDLLERENTRLKKKLSGFGAVEDNPNFDLQAFQKAMVTYSIYLIIPLVLIGPIIMAAARGWLPVTNTMVGPLPLFDPGTRGIGLGIIAFGGLACGVIAFGGGAIGIVAIGGGAIGVFAMGGGSVGIFAIGGGSFGLYAIGGGAFGRYVLAGDGRGKYVFSMKRQDPEAVAFWVRLFPRFRHAVTTPLPVIPVGAQDNDVNAERAGDGWS